MAKIGLKGAPKGRANEKRRKKQEGSPITVGGGGGRKKKLDYRVNAKFSELVYEDPEPGGNPKKKTFRNSMGLAMQSLRLEVSGVDTNLDTLIPVNKITLKFKGNDEEIIIYGKTMGIRIHTGKYQPVFGSNDHKSPDLTNYLKNVAIDSDLGWYERKFAEGERWELKTNTVATRKKAQR